MDKKVSVRVQCETEAVCEIRYIYNWKIEVLSASQILVFCFARFQHSSLENEGHIIPGTSQRTVRVRDLKKGYDYHSREYLSCMISCYKFEASLRLYAYSLSTFVRSVCEKRDDVPKSKLLCDWQGYKIETQMECVFAFRCSSQAKRVFIIFLSKASSIQNTNLNRRSFSR